MEVWVWIPLLAWKPFCLVLDMPLNLSGILTQGLTAIPLTWSYHEVSFHFKTFHHWRGRERFIFRLIKSWVVCISFKNDVNTKFPFFFFSVSLPTPYHHKCPKNLTHTFNILPGISLAKSASLLGLCSIFPITTDYGVVKLPSTTQKSWVSNPQNQFSPCLSRLPQQWCSPCPSGFLQRPSNFCLLLPSLKATCFRITRAAPHFQVSNSVTVLHCCILKSLKQSLYLMILWVKNSVKAQLDNSFAPQGISCS